LKFYPSLSKPWIRRRQWNMEENSGQERAGSCMALRKLDLSIKGAISKGPGWWPAWSLCHGTCRSCRGLSPRAGQPPSTPKCPKEHLWWCLACFRAVPPLEKDSKPLHCYPPARKCNRTGYTGIFDVFWLINLLESHRFRRFFAWSWKRLHLRQGDRLGLALLDATDTWYSNAPSTFYCSEASKLLCEGCSKVGGGRRGT